ncbi:G-protein alpha subunit-domain-containing protein [Cyathus striatus]|nr:G-protein alpha subunit-domain-containing protein [Cyathus striatus]
MQYRHIVYQNLIDSAQEVIAQVKKLGFDTVNRSLSFDYEIAKAIEALWKDPVISKRNLHLMDSAKYFFREVMRIGEKEYVPNETDTYGIIEMRFMMEKLSIHMIDVGFQRSRQKNWIHFFEDATSIIFCASLSEYDQMDLEKQSIINSRWFRRTSIILLLDNFDVFKLKIMKVPLERYFREYTGGHDVNKAAKYILWRFMQVNRAKLCVYPQYVFFVRVHDFSLIGKDSFSELVSTALMETTLKNTKIFRFLL